MTRKKTKTILNIRCLTLNAYSIAASIGSKSEEEVIRTFTDGRIVSRFTEHWIGSLFGVKIYRNAVNPKSDGRFKIEDNSGQKFELSCKCLTKYGIILQDSKFIGNKRKCTTEDLWNSVSSVDRICIADIRSFPNVFMFIIDSKLALTWIKDGKLTTSGKRPNKFYELITQSHDDVNYENYEIGIKESAYDVFNNKVMPTVEYIKTDTTHKIDEIEYIRRLNIEETSQHKLFQQ